MYLQKLEILGFKSFALKTTLEFNQKLTAIVGPNGSGKSNVADAIRWVLGEQSVKLLRGKRAEDVIFAGSDRKTRSGMAEVSIFLNNADGSAPIDYSEIVITRRVYRDGQSEYLLNNHPVRLIDINLLLARANFGQKTYSVIGQGMIDSILVSSPADRKEFFEEATGIKQYQIKREQSISKLGATYENLEQAELVLQEITPRLKTLTRQVKRLEKRGELESTLTELQKKYFGWRWAELTRHHEAIQSQYEKINQELENFKLSQQNLETKMSELQKTESLPQAYHDLKKRHDATRLELNKLIKEKTLAAAQDELKYIQKGEGEIAWLKRRREEIISEQTSVHSDLKLVTDTTAELEERLKTASGELDKLATNINLHTDNDSLAPRLKKRLRDLTNKYELWLIQVGRINSINELSQLLPQADNIKQELQTLITELDQSGAGDNWAQVLAQREGVVSEIAGIKAKLVALKDRQTGLNITLAKLNSELKNIDEALSGKGGRSVNDMADQITELEQKISELEKDMANFHQIAESAKQEFFALQNQLTQINQQTHAKENNLHELALSLAKIDTKKEDLEREMSQEIPPELALAIKTHPVSEPVSEGEMAMEIQKIKRQLEVTGGIEPEVVAEYQQTKERHDFLDKQQTDLKQAINSLEKIIQDLDATISKQFMVNFKAINEKFSKYFQVLFAGGRAQLNLQKIEPPKPDEAEVDEAADDAETKSDIDKNLVSQTAKEKFLLQEKLNANLFAGVEVQATPPGKKLSTINALSGGEKALTSIALICAIISHLPSPFVVLDEVDAALDEANSERFAAILDNLSNSTQFITITHNRATMKRSVILYGVTMGDDGISRLLSVKLDKAEEMVSN